MAAKKLRFLPHHFGKCGKCFLMFVSLDQSKDPKATSRYLDPDSLQAYLLLVVSTSRRGYLSYHKWNKLFEGRGPSLCLHAENKRNFIRRNDRMVFKLRKGNLKNSCGNFRTGYSWAKAAMAAPCFAKSEVCDPVKLHRTQYFLSCGNQTVTCTPQEAYDRSDSFLKVAKYWKDASWILTFYITDTLYEETR